MSAEPLEAPAPGPPGGASWLAGEELAPHEAQAIAHPSRRRIVAALGGAATGHSVSELASLMEMHPNAVRQHLEVLCRAGVVAGAVAPSSGRRGRPGTRYTLAAQRAVAGVGSRELLRLLLELVRRMGAGTSEGEAVGVDHGGRLVADGAPPEALAEAFAGLGFAPQDVTGAAGRSAGRRELLLRACPFKDAVLSQGGEIVCALHRGLVTGALARIDPGARLTAFEPNDPVRAGCRIAVEGLRPC